MNHFQVIKISKYHKWEISKNLIKDLTYFSDNSFYVQK